MLYLPLIDFQEQEIRLPAPSENVIEFCSHCSADRPSIACLSNCLFQCPGLLVYWAASYFKANQKAISSIDDLCGWLLTETLPVELDSEAFEPVGELDERLLKSLVSWQATRNRKGIRSVVRACTDLSRKQAKTLVDELFCREFWSDGCFSSTPDSYKWPIASSSDQQSAIGQLWMMTAKLQSLKRQFEETLFESKMKSLKQLAYGASHEINNPLANIASRAQSLLLDEQRVSRRQQLAVIYAQAMRAHEMISDMMLFAHPPGVEISSADLTDVVQQVFKEFRLELKDRNIDFRIRQYPEVQRCEIDINQFCVAIAALVRNSINAVGSDGQIGVQIWSCSPGRTAVSVWDTGPGIDDTIAEQIFDPFFSGREAGRGLGFGLSKAWRIVELHGGQLRLDRTWETGARFVMTIPNQQDLAKKKISRIDNQRAA